jgi:hypothetical protein
MFEGRRRLYIGDFSDSSTAAERKQMVPDYPTIEDFYRGWAGLRNCCGAKNDAFDVVDGARS